MSTDWTITEDTATSWTKVADVSSDDYALETESEETIITEDNDTLVVDDNTEWVKEVDTTTSWTKVSDV